MIQLQHKRRTVSAYTEAELRDGASWGPVATSVRSLAQQGSFPGGVIRIVPGRRARWIGME